jgi:hypothetical protein
VWEFVRARLAELPVDAAQAERQGHRLFDRMVAFHLVRGRRVALSAAQFLTGLAERFEERDGIYYLPGVKG